MTDYFDAFTTIARRHAISETRMDELVQKFGGRGPVTQIEDGSHTPPEDRPMEPFQTTADHIWVDGVCLYPDANGWVHGVGCPCEDCQRDAWVSEKEAERSR